MSLSGDESPKLAPPYSSSKDFRVAVKREEGADCLFYDVTVKVQFRGPNLSTNASFS